MDQKIVLELDRKVADQQSTLEKAGVTGFYVTTNPQVGAPGWPWHRLPKDQLRLGCQGDLTQGKGRFPALC